jgi:hypothetical protein
VRDNLSLKPDMYPYCKFKSPGHFNINQKL